MDPSLKDCTTCKHHHGKVSIDDVPDRCYPCVHREAALGYYPNWERIEPEDCDAGWQGYDKIIYMKQDNVNHPNHYKTGGIETIDYIRAKLGDEGTVAYCMGNVMKYTSRWQDKNGLEDLKKADWYLDYAINILENK
jgi:hypothetical protein